MKTLKTSLRLNGLPYTLIKRNEVVALYGIGGTYTDEIIHYEVDIIYTRKDKYGEREHIAKNDDFGRDFVNHGAKILHGSDFEVLLLFPNLK